MEDDVPFHERTSCEMYGCDWDDDDVKPGWRTCRDCGDTYEQ